MKMLGAKVIPATSGSKHSTTRQRSLEAWMKDPENFYLIGSAVGPQPYPEMVARFQSVISEEIKKQLKEKTGKKILITSSLGLGGGSNAAGAFYHSLTNRLFV